MTARDLLDAPAQVWAFDGLFYRWNGSRTVRVIDSRTGEDVDVFSFSEVPTEAEVEDAIGDHVRERREEADR